MFESIGREGSLVGATAAADDADTTTATATPSVASSSESLSSVAGVGQMVLDSGGDVGAVIVFDGEAAA